MERNVNSSENKVLFKKLQMRGYSLALLAEVL